MRNHYLNIIKSALTIVNTTSKDCFNKPHIIEMYELHLQSFKANNKTLSWISKHYLTFLRYLLNRLDLFLFDLILMLIMLTHYAGFPKIKPGISNVATALFI